ncbi:MAG: hypothetical protein EPN30_06070 [Actinomycetota bacterium]|nr:MAG: hypothetical protein EPN30_06070 [Actinomycetota bacterium]
MASFPAPFSKLIEYVQSLHPEAGPLEHLMDAVITAQAQNDQSDALIGYFVDQARVSGASWSQIGAAMGVTKQAVQKRFTAGDELLPKGKAFSRFTPRARIAVAAAGRLAESAGDVMIDAPHLAAGTLADPEGLAARALRLLEIDFDQLYRELSIGPASAGDDPEPSTLLRFQYSSACREAFKDAFKAAIRLGHNYIGTEHLLIALVSGEGAVRQAFANLGIGVDLIQSAVTAEIANLVLKLKRVEGKYSGE